MTLPSTIRHRVCLLLASGCFLAMTYPTTNLLATGRPDALVLATTWDRYIPLLPGFSAVYLSIFGVVTLAAARLPLDAVLVLAARCNAAIGLAALIFLIWPTRVASRIDGHPVTDPLLAWIRRLDPPCNGFPSLHIAIGATVAWIVLRVAHGPLTKWIMATWMVALIASVLFTHQHYIVDVLGGLLLAASVAAIPQRALRGFTLGVPARLHRIES